MSKLFKVNNFGSGGLNKDMPPWDLPPNVVTEIQNMRYQNGRFISNGGFETWADTPSGEEFGHIEPVREISANLYMMAGDTKIYKYDGTTFTDISHASGYAAISVSEIHEWNSCDLAQIKIMNHYDDYPQTFNHNVDTVMQDLTFDSGAGSTWRSLSYHARVMRAHMNFLFALGINEAGTEYPTMIRWSDLADTGALPTDWDETDPTNKAGKTVLAEGSGPIVDGLSLRDRFMVYREKGIYVADFIGGVYVWRFRSFTQNAGVLARNCIAEIRGKHVVFGDGDIYVTDGNSINSVVHNRIRKHINATIDTDNFQQSFVLNNKPKKEIWFCYPQNNYARPNIAAVWNWEDDSWSLRDLPNIAHACGGPRNESAPTWTTVSGTWETIDSEWAEREYSPVDDTIIGVRLTTGSDESDPSDDQGDDLVVLDTTASDSSYTALIERTNLVFDSQTDVETIQAVYPHIECTESVIVQIGSQQYRDGPVEWKSEVTFTPGTDKKIEVRSTGQLHAWRVKKIGTTNMEVAGMDFEFVEAGKR